MDQQSDEEYGAEIIDRMLDAQCEIVDAQDAILETLETLRGYVALVALAAFGACIFSFTLLVYALCQ